MALTTIHMDDRRNITPKMTQALQRNKTLRNLTEKTPPCWFTQWQWHNPRHWDPTIICHFHCDHQFENWYRIISRRIQFRILSPKSTPWERGSPSYITLQLPMNAGMEGSLRPWIPPPMSGNTVFHSSSSWMVQRLVANSRDSSTRHLELCHLTCCLILVKLLNFFQPLFPYLSNGNIFYPAMKWDNAQSNPWMLA